MITTAQLEEMRRRLREVVADYDLPASTDVKVEIHGADESLVEAVAAMDGAERYTLDVFGREVDTASNSDLDRCRVTAFKREGDERIAGEDAVDAEAAF